jgi:membrane-associated phospholipid phosphatase
MSAAANRSVAVTRFLPGLPDWRVLAAAALCLGSALIAVYRQQEWEFPVIRLVNAFAHRWALLDRTMHALTTRDLLQGVPFIAIIWFLWFDTADRYQRARLLVGTLAASAAGVVSRLLQLMLPTHLRPLHDARLDFTLPFGVEPEALNHYNSFPSDHGAVYFALCMVIWQLRPRLGAAALVWAAIIDLARVYEGYHFPSDVAGSIGLGVLMLWLARPVRASAPVSRVLAFEQSHKAWFYMLAFLVTFQIATLFDDAREIGRGFTAVLLHHEGFNNPM